MQRQAFQGVRKLKEWSRALEKSTHTNRTVMFTAKEIFSSFSVDDTKEALGFYEQTLGLPIQLVPAMAEMGILQLQPVPGVRILIYPKADHRPAPYTVLNIVVENIDSAVADLRQKGVLFEQDDAPGYRTDEQGICRSQGPEPDIAWFKDPAKNIISVMQQQPSSK